MAAVGGSPSGFSYAQAAKGRSSATPSSKVTSGVATPATGALSDLAPGSNSNWADDVEASVGDKMPEAHKPAREQSIGMDGKGGVERAKLEDRIQNAPSGVSSPDMAASASSTSKEDDSSTAQNGASSETTWESKSSASAGEPSWITEREKRQAQGEDNGKDADKKKKKSEKTEEPPKPVVLTESAPPAVNPWAKRAEQAKAKITPVQTPRPTSNSTTKDSPPQLKENQPPRADPRKKVTPSNGAPNVADAANKPNNMPQNRRANDVRNSRPGSKSGADETQSATASSNVAALSQPTERQGLPGRASRPPPPVRDEVSWPTPETALEQDRKAADKAAEPDQDDKHEEDVNQGAKPRKKPQWQTVPVVPNIIWETQGVRERGSRGLPTGERGGRGGASSRGRGGMRGAPNNLGGDRPNRTQASDGNGVPRGRSDTGERGPTAAPAKPDRTSSTNSSAQRDADARVERGAANQNPAEIPASVAPDTAPIVANGTATGKSTRQAKPAPSKESSALGSQDEVQIPEPIPRRSSTGTQTEQNGNVTEVAQSDNQTLKNTPTEGRKERQFENFREPSWHPPTRGAKRGGRGRGGSREFANANHGNHAYGVHPPDFNSSFTPTSPYNGTRGGHQHNFPGPARGWHGNGSRTRSLPMDNFYGRYNGAYPPPPVNTFMPGMAEYNAFPLTAVPYTPMMDHQHLMNMVRMQLEYYFSIDNMLKDLFLRKNMDSQGFVFLDLIAGFNRIKILTQDLELLKAVCMSADNIEIRVGEDGRERLRMREEWQQFVLPMDQRESGAQNDGPQQLQRPEPPQLQIFAPQGLGMRGPASAGLPSMQHRQDRRSHDSGLPMTNGMSPYPAFAAIPESGNSDATNGEEARGRSVKSPMHDSSVSPSHQLPDGEQDNEGDAFPDVHIEHLTVVVRSETAGKPRMPYHSLASRTFSNGSIDTRNIFNEAEKNGEGQSPPAANGDATVNGTEQNGSISRHASPSHLRSPKTDPSSQISLFWVKDKEAPVDQLPSDVSPEPYSQLRMKAMDQRNHASTGNCPYDMDVLYQFWSHFLIRNFNGRMYGEFHQLALDDANTRHTRTGISNLIKYYSEALLNPKPIRDRVLQDYVDLVKSETPKQEGQAFKQLRAAWRNGALNLKNRKKLGDIADDELKAQLEA